MKTRIWIALFSALSLALFGGCGDDKGFNSESEILALEHDDGDGHAEEEHAEDVHEEGDGHAEEEHEDDR